MKRQKDRTLKDELPWLVGAQYATGDQWRTNSRKNEQMEPKQNDNKFKIISWIRREEEGEVYVSATGIKNVADYRKA